ncbi:NAD-dependent epimerase/dehydratase family protein [Mucilaginibacter mali]|uniref:NAD-dependent epimerase/dehydratase family protein n=1 Tax=Mucilaginibacter mali TaxID=2740462 RepID=A0A7D4QE30_9SPHI|nr:NAD-dependent epimerase/dehydratase family protein [Mucilaginibacter mali]QKJ29412.1 NAD-dependent epimerase/dehydratase family protein [Mucilaginibacter mali]
MKVIITGATGFLGKTIVQNLIALQHDVFTLARDNADITSDLAINIPSLPACDLLIHAAGKAHIVPKTEEEKKDFFDVNVKGTQNLLRGSEASGLPKSFVFISSVAVYGLESGTNIKEDMPLLAKEAYGESKIEAERLVWAWCQKNNVTCTILRLPLLAGSNPPGNLGAMILGIKKGYYFNIAGGKAKKSIVLIDDVANAVLTAASTGGIYNLTDGYNPSFYELSTFIAKQLHKKQPFNMPYFIAKMLAFTGDIIGSKSPINSVKLNKITADLTFDDSKARALLKWAPQPVLKGLKL